MTDSDVGGAHGGPVVRLETDGGVRVIHLCRPPANAMDARFVSQMNALLDQVDSDEACRAVLILSDLDVFALGGDIHMLESSGNELDEEFRVGIQKLFDRIECLAVPVVAGIRGHAVGGGLELALACDIRVVGDDDAIGLGLPEVRLGLLPGAGGTQRLTHLVGRTRALDLLLSGRTLTPAEAKDWGIVTHVVPMIEVEDAARRRAHDLASGPTAAYRAIKACVRAAAHGDLADGLAVERREAGALMQTADAAEGLLAFVEKRRPNFTGS